MPGPRLSTVVGGRCSSRKDKPAPEGARKASNARATAGDWSAENELTVSIAPAAQKSRHPWRFGRFATDWSAWALPNGRPNAARSLFVLQQRTRAGSGSPGGSAHV